MSRLPYNIDLHCGLIEGGFEYSQYDPFTLETLEDPNLYNSYNLVFRSIDYYISETMLIKVDRTGKIIDIEPRHISRSKRFDNDYLRLDKESGYFPDKTKEWWIVRYLENTDEGYYSWNSEMFETYDEALATFNLRSDSKKLAFRGLGNHFSEFVPL